MYLFLYESIVYKEIYFETPISSFNKWDIFFLTKLNALGSVKIVNLKKQ